MSSVGKRVQKRLKKSTYFSITVSVPLFLEGVSSFMIEVEKQTKHLRGFRGFDGISGVVDWLVLLAFWGVCVGFMVCYTKIRINEHTQIVHKSSHA